jgi:CPA2 family monovalent cation:H+ antiporter-2
MSHRNAEQQFDLQWVRLSQESPIIHRSIGESEIRKRTGVCVVGVVREEQLRPNPDADFVLLPDDLVAIIGSESNRKAFLLMASSTP